MELEEFLDLLHDGAFYVFETVIQCLPNRDLKALRLCLNRSLADSIFPYMFRNVYFSVHQEDHDVFQRISDHPVANRYVKQILWNVTNPTTTLHRYKGDQRKHGYISLLAYDRHPTPNEAEAKRHMTATEIDENYSLYLQASDFWVGKEIAWSKSTNQRLDLMLFKESLQKFPNLRRLTILMEQTWPCIPSHDLDFLWSTPRSRAWNTLPFRSILLPPRPRTQGDSTGGYTRMMRFLAKLCNDVDDVKFSIGSIIIESFGRSQLPQSNSSKLDAYQQPYRGFGTLLDGFSASIPDLKDPHHITLRMMIELDPREESPWQYRTTIRRPIDLLAQACHSTLTELTYSRVNLQCLVDYYTDQPVNPSSHHNQNLNQPAATIPFYHLTHTKNLRTIRLHECWCPDAGYILKWLNDNTTATHIVLHSVSSLRMSWYGVFNWLKTQGVRFESLELIRCRSPQDVFGVQFEAEMLAPWNGGGKETVEWLRGERGAFPLWQGPG